MIFQEKVGTVPLTQFGCRAEPVSASAVFSRWAAVAAVSDTLLTVFARADTNKSEYPHDSDAIGELPPNWLNRPASPPSYSNSLCEKSVPEMPELQLLEHLPRCASVGGRHA